MKKYEYMADDLKRKTKQNKEAVKVSTSDCYSVEQKHHIAGKPCRKIIYLLNCDKRLKKEIELSLTIKLPEMFMSGIT